MQNFVQTEKFIELSKQYSKHFGGTFALMEPDSLVLDFGDDFVFVVPKWETPSDFELTLRKSINEGVNYFIERYKDFKMFICDDAVY